MPIFIYGAVEKILCSDRLGHVHYVAIDDLLITTPWKNDISALWSRSGKADASLLGQDVVASLLSLCMAKWLRKWRRGWLYVRSNTKNAKSLMTFKWRQNHKNLDFQILGCGLEEIVIIIKKKTFILTYIRRVGHVDCAICEQTFQYHTRYDTSRHQKRSNEGDVFTHNQMTTSSVFFEIVKSKQTLLICKIWL